MRKHLNWYEVQELVRTVVDKPSYLAFKQAMTAQFADLSRQIVSAKAIMNEAQRIFAEDKTKANRINLSVAQNHRRVLGIHAETINTARHTAKMHAKKLAKLQVETHH